MVAYIYVEGYIYKNSLVFWLVVILKHDTTLPGHPESHLFVTHVDQVEPFI